MSIGLTDGPTLLKQFDDLSSGKRTREIARHKLLIRLYDLRREQSKWKREPPQDLVFGEETIQGMLKDTELRLGNCNSPIQLPEEAQGKTSRIMASRVGRPNQQKLLDEDIQMIYDAFGNRLALLLQSMKDPIKFYIHPQLHESILRGILRRGSDQGSHQGACNRSSTGNAWNREQQLDDYKGSKRQLADDDGDGDGDGSCPSKKLRVAPQGFRTSAANTSQDVDLSADSGEESNPPHIQQDFVYPRVHTLTGLKTSVPSAPQMRGDVNTEQNGEDANTEQNGEDANTPRNGGHANTPQDGKIESSLWHPVVQPVWSGTGDPSHLIYDGQSCIARSADRLIQYRWSAIEAAKTMVKKTAMPTSSDVLWLYYIVPRLEVQKLPFPGLLKRIQRSQHWKEGEQGLTETVYLRLAFPRAHMNKYGVYCHVSCIISAEDAPQFDELVHPMPFLL
jgi:hypothetical protein